MGRSTITVEWSNPDAMLLIEAALDDLMSQLVEIDSDVAIDATMNAKKSGPVVKPYPKYLW